MREGPPGQPAPGSEGHERGPEELREVMIRRTLGQRMSEAILYLSKGERGDMFDAAVAELHGVTAPTPEERRRHRTQLLHQAMGGELQDRVMREWQRGDDTLLVATFLRIDANQKLFDREVGEEADRVFELLQEQQPLGEHEAASAESPPVDPNDFERVTAEHEAETRTMRETILNSSRFGGKPAANDIVDWARGREEELRGWAAGGSEGKRIPLNPEDMERMRLFDRILGQGVRPEDREAIQRELDEQLHALLQFTNETYEHALSGDELRLQDLEHSTKEAAELYQLRESLNAPPAAEA